MVTETTETGVVLAWEPPRGNADVVGYGIYLGGILVATTSEAAYALAGLSCGTTYTVGVDAVDASGNRSDPSEMIVMTSRCPDATAPPRPTDLHQLDATETSVSFAWSGSNQSGAGYGVYQNGVRVGETQTTTYSLAGLVCGTGYTVAVDAYDQSGNRSAQVSIVLSTSPCPGLLPPDPTEPPSDPPQLPPPPESDSQSPSRPGNVTVGARSETTVALAWADARDNVGVVGYGLYANGDLVGTTSQNSYTFAGLTCATTYALAVDAFDAAGNRSERASVDASTDDCPEEASAPSDDTEAPSAPSGLVVATSTETSVSVRWNPSSDNVGVVGYRIYRDGQLSGATSQTDYILEGVACGTSYTIAVDAYDAAGNYGDRTEVVLATNACSMTETQTPSAPDNQAITEITRSKSLRPRKDREPPTTPAGVIVTGSTLTTVSLAWNASTDNVGVTGYGIYLGGVRVGTTAQTSYMISGLACGTSQTVAADAYDAAGNRSSAASLIVTTTACPDTQPPSIPGSLAQTSRTQTSIAVAWAPSTDNIGVVGYSLYRDGVRIGTTAQTSYVFSGLTCGTHYTLGVDAYDASGNRSARATVLMTTAACSTSDPRPLEPEPASSYQIPATIADDCSVDVTQPILSWIASVPNNSTLSFVAGACYRIEGTLELRNRSGLAFEGNGATFRSLNAPADQRAIWRVIDSTDLVFDNMTIIGSYTSGGTFNASLQHAHAIDLRGTSVEVAGVTMSDLAGDCVNFALGYTSALTRSSGSVHDSSCSRTSRSAVSLTAANDVTVTRTTADRIGLSVFNVEPNDGPGWGSERATFDNNTIGSYYLYAFAIVQDGPVRDQAFTNNIVSGRGLRIGIVAPGGAYRPANVTITGNRADKAESPAAVEAHNVDGLTVTGNIIPLTGGTMAAVDNTCAANVSGNAYPGGSKEVSITNTPVSCATATPHN